jgi:allantoate deiminase
VLAFGDEEGSRFPATMASSSACAGVFEHETLPLADAQGITLDAALRAYGKDPALIPKAAYRPQEVAAYVEVHIEQGPILEANGQPLGVVSGIVGQSRLRVTVSGEAGHAGTVPMAMRHDAFAGAAEMALALETIARGNPSDGLVGTVGRLEALPGAVNIIPGRVVFTVDVRALTDGVRIGAVERFLGESRRIANERGLAVEAETFHEIATAHCAGPLQDMLAASIGALGHDAIRLPSGAGHDAQVMARLCPSAMLFVRCRGGISHNPAEYASVPDMGLAIAALIGFIERFKDA